MRGRLAILVLFAFLPALRAQGIIATLAGTDWLFQDNDRPATSAALGPVLRLASSPQGDIYAVDPENCMAFRIRPNGTLNVVAGNGDCEFYGDGGPATQAGLNRPVGIAADGAGNVYIADEYAGRVRRVNRDGIISTVAGNGGFGFNGDGIEATSAQLSAPNDVAIDSSGDLYIADPLNHRVRKVSMTTGRIQTVAGTGEMGYSGDNGPATAAQLSFPVGLFVDSSNRLYIAGDRYIRRVTNGTIQTIAGVDDYLEAEDGIPATRASFGRPFDVAIDAAGAIYLADPAAGRIRRIDPDGIIRTVAGNGDIGFSPDGSTAAQAALNNPSGVAVDPEGRVYLADTDNNRIRRIVGGRLETAAGNNRYKFGGDGGPASAGLLRGPSGLARDRNGNLYIADTKNNRVRKITPSNVISTFAGDGFARFAGDGGPAVNASLNQPVDLAFDAAGNLYISDYVNDRIRKVDTNGIITTYVGGGTQDPPTQALSMQLSRPTGLAFDRAGNLYIGDQLEIRKVAPNGMVTAFAGSGSAESSGDGGPALLAGLGYVSGMAVDSKDNLYFAEDFGGRVRKISGGIITTYAGDPKVECCLGDQGPATMAGISSRTVFIDANDNLYIGGRGRVRKVTPAGIISRVAGGGDLPEGTTGDGGSALAARIVDVRGLAVDAIGTVYIADEIDDRVRVVYNTPPQFSVSKLRLDFTGKSGGSPPVDQTVFLNSALTNLGFEVTTTTFNGSWLTATPDFGLIPGTIQVRVNPFDLSPGTYEGKVSINARNANPPLQEVVVHFVVTPSDAPKLRAEPSYFNFDFVPGQLPSTEILSVRNDGSGTLSFNATATTVFGGDWLTISPASGSATSAAPVPLTVRANPGTLGPGTYSGLIRVTSPQDPVPALVPVTMVVQSSTQSLALSVDGVTFRSVAGSTASLTDGFFVLNTGSGNMDWTTTAAITSTGTPNWLSVSPPTGASGPGGTQPPFVKVTVNPTNLPLGDYFGTVTINAPGVSNSPQVLSVVFQITTPDDAARPDLRPTGLLFVGLPNGEAIPQTVQVTNVGTGATTYRSTAASDSGPLFFSYQPSEGTLTPGQPAVISIQPVLTRITPGVRRGRITLQFGNDTTRVIEILLVVPLITSSGSPPRSAVAGCTPQNLNLVFSSLGQQFQVPAAYPSNLEVKVADNCGTPLVSGSVEVSFSTGDRPVSLVPLADGRWGGSWVPSRDPGSARLTATALSADRALTGTTQASGDVRPSESGPVIAPGSVLNGTSFESGVPLPPGGIVTIYGQRLSFGEGRAGVPRETILNQTLVTLGSSILPLLYVSESQINALVPFNVTINTKSQLYVRHVDGVTTPVDVQVAAAQPAIFSLRGPGSPGLIFGADGQLIDASRPVGGGDVVVIFCSGLGAVNPPVSIATAAPGDVLAHTVNPVEVTVGGVPARVDFAGLAPGFTGLYQINAVLGAGMRPGPDAEVRINVAGQVSAPVTLAVR